MKSQMKSYFFDLKNPVSIIGLVATFNLVCDMSDIHKEATTLVLPHYEKETLTIVLNSLMCAKMRLSPFPSSVRSEDTRFRKVSHSCALTQRW